MDPLIIGSIIDNMAGMFGQGMANQQNQALASQQQAWSERMQNQQNRFNLDMFHLANQYNSPQAQMARFAEAGLNPHLIYGKGTPGNTQAIKSADVKPYTRAEAKNVMEGMSVFGDYQRFKNLQAQTDNTNANTDVQRITAALQGLKANGQLISNLKGRISLRRYGDLINSQADGAAIANEKLQEEIRKISADATRSELNAILDFKSMPYKLAKTIQDARNASLDGDIKEMVKAIKAYEIHLNKLGLTKGDPGWWRKMDALFEWLQPNFVPNQDGEWLPNNAR
jgi:hypothetical protein